MKKLIHKLLNLVFNLDNRSVVLKMLPIAVAELTSYHGKSRFTKESLWRTLIIQTRTRLNKKQFAHLLRILPFHVQQSGFNYEIIHNNIWVTQL